MSARTSLRSISNIKFRFWKWIPAIVCVYTSDTVFITELIFIYCIYFKNKTMIIQDDHVMYIDWLVMQAVVMFYMANTERAIFFLTLHNCTTIAQHPYNIYTNSNILNWNLKKIMVTFLFFEFYILLQLSIMFKMFNYEKKKQSITLEEHNQLGNLMIWNYCACFKG